MNIRTLFHSAVLLALCTGTATAADSAAGKALHDKHCLSCHVSLGGGNADHLYTRANRRVTTPAGLTKQVKRCELSLGLKWFDDDIDNVAAHLNQTFYKFK